MPPGLCLGEDRRHAAAVDGGIGVGRHVGRTGSLSGQSSCIYKYIRSRRRRISSLPCTV
jgi:hypothetical protein